MSLRNFTAGIAAGTFLATLGAAAAQQKPPAKPGAKPTAAQAKALENYRTVCQPCHGPDGKGIMPEMDLADGDWKHGTSTQAIAKIIAEGVPGTAMLPNKDKFTQAEMLELARLVRSFDPSLKPEKAPAKK
jgi:mono/diheme cytochrome c family protein